MTGTDFDRAPDRAGTWSEKWDRYRGRDVIPMWVADMDFSAPPVVLEALSARVAHGVFGYTGVPDELAQAVVAHLAAEYDWAIATDWLVWLPGLVVGLNVTCRAVGDPGDGVLTATPVYPPFLSAPRLSNRELAAVPLGRETDGRWVLDLDAMARAVTPRTRLLLLCSPHNPVGRAWTREELEGLAAFCERHDLVIGSDEIHCGLVLDPGRRHVPVATLDPAIARRTITLMAPSKTFNIPGLGCAFAVISNPALRRRFRETMAGIVPHVNAMGLAAALAAYRDGAGWHRALLEYLRGNRALVEASIGALRALAVSPVEATYLAWIDARGIGVENPARFFEEAGVGLSDGRDFGGPGFVRLNFGCTRALLGEALGRIEGALLARRPASP